MTLGAGRVRELLDRHDVRLRQSLGQNFVVDPNTVERIVRLAGIEPGDRVVEIGAGCGSLTVALADAGARVTAIEIDGRLIPVLAEVLDGLAVEVLNVDATGLDWDALCGDDRWVLVANLPYNVGTGIVLDALVDAPRIDRMVVMVQREVAERFVAPAGSALRGIPSVVVDHFATAEIVARVPPTVFFPTPRVDSAVVRLDRHDDADAFARWVGVEPLVRAAFGQRRKMVRRSLAALAEPGDFVAADVNESARPEELTVAQWLRLAEAVAGGAS
ncbi:MAG: 16S rRNA (adenine(1518)-N(6)/adenine(1519)-N(6))-dimethyltransferase RsmA [Acidimicrobiales bacterium]